MKTSTLETANPNPLFSYQPDRVLDEIIKLDSKAFVLACFLFRHLDCGRGEISIADIEEFGAHVNMSPKCAVKTMNKLVWEKYFTTEYRDNKWRIRSNYVA